MGYIKLKRLAGLFLLVLLAVLPQSKAAYGATITEIIANNGVYGCRREFGAGYYDAVANKTFVCWSGPKMDVYVNDYDHTTLSWGEPKKVSDISDGTRWAYHHYPTMVKLPDGTPGIFYAIHAKKARLAKAPNAHSIEGTWTTTTISNNRNCYPMPAVSGNNVYFFYSEDTDGSWPYRRYRYIKSTDNGTTWSNPVNIVDTGKTGDKFNEVYAFGVDEKDGQIGISFVMSGGPQGHVSASKNLYYVELNTTTDTAENALGENLGSSVNGLDELEKCKVTTAAPSSTGSKHPIFTGKPILYGDGSVMIGYGMRDNENNVDRIELAKFESGNWTKSTIVPGSRHFLDMKLNEANTLEILHGTPEGTFKNLISHDLGESWTEDYTITPQYNNGADATAALNYIESAKTVKVIGTTIDVSDKYTDYSGKWPIYAVMDVENDDENNELNIIEDFSATTTGDVPSDWLIYTKGGSVGVVEDPSTTNKSLKLEDTSNVEPVGARISFDDTADPVTIQFNLKRSGQGYAYVNIISGQIEAVKLLMTPTEMSVHNGSHYIKVQNYQHHTWYNIKIVANPITDKADIYVDDVLKLSQVNFKNKTSSLDTFSVSTHSALEGTTINLDDVTIEK